MQAIRAMKATGSTKRLAVVLAASAALPDADSETETIAAEPSAVGKLMTLIKETEEMKKDIMRQFSGFQTGDKDSYSHDEKSQTAIRNAVASSQGSGVMRADYLRSGYTTRALDQTRSVLMKTVLPALGVAPFNGSSAVSWNDLASLEQRLADPQSEVGAAAVAEIQRRVRVVRGTPVGENPGSVHSETDTLNASKVYRTALIRSALLDIDMAKQFIERRAENVIDDPNLRRLLDLRADAWTDLAVTW